MVSQLVMKEQYDKDKKETSVDVGQKVTHVAKSSDSDGIAHRDRTSFPVNVEIKWEDQTVDALCLRLFTPRFDVV